MILMIVIIVIVLLSIIIFLVFLIVIVSLFVLLCIYNDCTGMLLAAGGGLVVGDRCLLSKELDIFKLDIIARELKSLDNELGLVGKEVLSGALNARSHEERFSVSVCVCVRIRPSFSNRVQGGSRTSVTSSRSISCSLSQLLFLVAGLVDCLGTGDVRCCRHGSKMPTTEYR